MIESVFLELKIFKTFTINIHLPPPKYLLKIDKRF